MLSMVPLFYQIAQHPITLTAVGSVRSPMLVDRSDKAFLRMENFADSVRWQLQKVSAEKEKFSAGILRLLGGVSLWQ